MIDRETQARQAMPRRVQSQVFPFTFHRCHWYLSPTVSSGLFSLTSPLTALTLHAHLALQFLQQYAYGTNPPCNSSARNACIGPWYTQNA